MQRSTFKTKTIFRDGMLPNDSSASHPQLRPDLANGVFLDGGDEHPVHLNVLDCHQYPAEIAILATFNSI